MPLGSFVVQPNDDIHPSRSDKVSDSYTAMVLTRPL